MFWSVAWLVFLAGCLGLILGFMVAGIHDASCGLMFAGLATLLLSWESRDDA